MGLGVAAPFTGGASLAVLAGLGGLEAYTSYKAGQTQSDAAEAAAGRLAPYGNLGNLGAGQLAAGFAPGGEFRQTFTAPTAEEARATPGYQFSVDQAQKADERGAAARGTLLSGGFQRSLNRDIMGLADENYGQVYNRAFNQFQTSQGNLYNRLMGITGLGLGAQNAANADTTSAAAARAAGGVGAVNAITGTVGGLINANQEQRLLDRINGPAAPNTASSYVAPSGPTQPYQFQTPDFGAGLYGNMGRLAEAA